MPLRTAYKLCPQAVFVEGHRERYVEYSHKVYEVLQRFSPRVEMASIDEAYLDLTGTERLLGPPLAAAHSLHNAVHAATDLNCSVGAASSRLVAKIASDQAKPHGILWIPPGCEARFLAPLDVRKIPGVGKVTERNLHGCGIRKIGDLAQLDQTFLEDRFGKWGLALAGKARGEDAGGWFDGEIGEGDDPKSISHEHVFGRYRGRVRTRRHAGAAFRWSPQAARSPFTRTHGTDQIALLDFPPSPARTLDHATQIDTEFAARCAICFTRIDERTHSPAGVLRTIARKRGGADQPARRREYCALARR
jgi:nucleotidyltransferase/DNA polymerase involved in DNA repair